MAGQPGGTRWRGDQAPGAPGLFGPRLAKLDRVLRTERTMVRIRWVAAAFGLEQALTYYRPYPPDMLPLALILTGVLAAANVVVWLAVRRTSTERSARRLSVTSLVLDAAVVLGFVFVYTFDEQTAIWALIYILPLEAAIRFQLKGALATMAVATLVYAAREVYGASVFGNDLLLTSITFRMGIGFIIAGVSGAMASSLVRDREQLELGAQHYESLLTALSDLGEGVIILGPDRILYVNDALCEIGGYSREEILALPDFLNVVAPQDRGMPAERFRSRLARQSVTDHYETSLIRKDGRTANVEVSVKPIHLGAGTEVLAIVRDITRRKQAEQELADAYAREHEAVRRLEELDELKSDFLSTVSHELRTPLTSIGGFSSTLVTWWPKLEEDRRLEFIQRIKASSEQLNHLITELLDFTRLERGQLRIELQPFDLRGEVLAVTHRLESILARHRVEVEVPAHLVAMADRDALSRILENLLANAAKFSSEGTRIAVRARESGREEVVIEVEDEGIGIPREESERIFQRFYRVGRSSTSASGTGIGLAIVKEFAEAQGGRVWVESEEGLGSTFGVALKRVQGVQGVGDRNGSDPPAGSIEG